MLNTELCKRYAELKKTVKDATAEMEEINEVLSSELELCDDNEEVTTYGKFKLKSSKRWKYPKDVEAKADDIYLEAQLSGLAEQVVSRSLVFNPIKEK